MEFVRGRGLAGAHGRPLATSAFRWIYTRAPLAPRAFTKVAKANGVAPLRTVASLLTADRNLLTEMAWELDGFRIPPGFERIGPIFAHIDAPLPAHRRAIWPRHPTPSSTSASARRPTADSRSRPRGRSAGCR